MKMGTEPLTLKEMKFKSFRAKLDAANAASSFEFIYIVTFILFFFYSYNLTAQINPVQFESVVEYSVQKDLITGFESQTLQYAVSSDSLLYIPMGFKHSSKKFILAVFDLKNDSLRFYSFLFPRNYKIDSRVQNGSLLIEDPHKLYIAYDGRMSLLNFDSGYLDKPLKLKNYYTNFISNGKEFYSLVNYSFSKGQDYAIAIASFRKPSKEKRIDLFTTEPEFFNFGKTKLWTFNNKILIHADVTNPTLTCYDSHLKVIAKHNLNIDCWKTSSDINLETQLDTIVRKSDRFTRAISYLEYGISKTLDLSHIKNDIYQLVFANGMAGYSVIYFRIDQLGNLIDVSDCYVISKKELLMNNNWITFGNEIFRVEILPPSSIDEDNFKFRISEYLIKVPFF